MDGHGDLLADDIYCLDDGPRILDCLDFDDRLRWLDGLDDAAFLAMDLERLGAAPIWPGSSSDWYAEYSGDPAPASLRSSLRRLSRLRAGEGRLHPGRPGRACCWPGEARQLGRSRAPAPAGWERWPWSWSAGCPGTGKSALAGRRRRQSRLRRS